MTDFQHTQDRHFVAADAAHYRWTTEDPAFAPVEDALLGPALAELRFPCLEIGCGEGTNLARLVRRGAAIGIDRSIDKLRFAAGVVPAARLVAADALALPFGDGAFPGVLVRDLLHHVTDRRQAAAEAVLRRFTPENVLAALAGLPLAPPRVEMAQGLPLRRLVLHYRFGWPALGRSRAGAALLARLEDFGSRLLPRRRWSYTVVRSQHL